jgi:osmoprotectant transport system permease protein
MEETQSFWQFVDQQSDKLWSQTGTHLGLTLISLIFAIMVAVPIGVIMARRPGFSGPVIGLTGVLQTIPSIALLGILIPFLGIGAKPAILALFLYALLPILRNTFTGIQSVDPVVKDAAKGMGMSSLQVLFKVELPLAFPVMMAGIRTAAVINVGVTTLAAYIAAGGLGEFIFGGIALNDSNMILAGAIPAALLAILLDFLLSVLQKVSVRKLKLSHILWPSIILMMCSFFLIPTSFSTKLRAGFTPEFMGRSDGYIGLKEVYNLDIETVVISDAMKYKAVFEKEIDVIDGYSTDGRVKVYQLTTLVDDQHIFPPYHAAPIVRASVLTQYPDLEGVLNQIAGLINDEVMTDLNYKVDKLQQSPEKVAEDFLKQKHLYKPDRNGKNGVIRIGSKIFGEQYILAQLYKLLIQGNLDVSVETKTGLGGTKICFDALVHQQIDLYPEYTGTGFLVILAADKQRVKELAQNADAVYNYVQDQFLKRYQIKWLKPIGFNNSYSLMMRRDQAQSLRIKSISDLTLYLNKQ